MFVLFIGKKTFYSSMGTISLWLIVQEILRPKAQNLGMRFATRSCCRPNTTIPGSLLKDILFC